jgi:hypothetical protein
MMVPGFSDAGFSLRVLVLAWTKIRRSKSLCKKWEIVVGRGLSHDINSVKLVRL